jgi:hypothetical protein
MEKSIYDNLFLSINASKIKSCRLGEKRRTKVSYINFNSSAFRFQAKVKPGLDMPAAPYYLYIVIIGEGTSRLERIEPHLILKRSTTPAWDTKNHQTYTWAKYHFESELSVGGRSA